MIGAARLLSGGLALVLLPAAGCTSAGRKPPVSSDAPAPSVGISRTTDTETTSVTGPGSVGFVGTCQTSVHGDLGTAWHRDKDAVVVGPLALLYPGAYKREPRSAFLPRANRYRSQKVLVIVAQGVTASVAIASNATRVASLMYDPTRFGYSGYTVTDGERAVTFRACAKGAGPPNAATQFNGGFIVAGAQCVPVQIRLGNAAAPVRRVLSFGAGNCRGMTVDSTP